MGGGKGGSGQKAAEQDWQNTKEGVQTQTTANRPDIVTPWGTQTWDQQGDQWTQTTTLNPEEQAAKESQDRIQAGRSGAAETLLGQATGAFQKDFDWENMPQREDLASVGYDPANARDNAEKALYDRQMSKINPALDRSEDARRARMANMGFALEGGSQGFERAQAGMDEARQKATQDAAWQSIIGGGQEASQELSRATGAAGFGNTNRQSAIAEEAQRRGMPLNELNALLSGQQVNMPNMPDFKSAERASGSNMLGGAKMDAENKMDIGSLVGTAAKAYTMSDRRLKRNIKALGRGWYSYNYVWGGPRHVGVMAQEVILTNPEAVAVHPSGYMMVDYSKL
ncbi:MAG: tail fiber domain-containing protein [Gammaproteobacteria bacterium]|nr:tail fiber domain-containing protein [Gammaproteobacteria bacterium]